MGGKMCCTIIHIVGRSLLILLECNKLFLSRKLLLLLLTVIFVVNWRQHIKRRRIYDRTHVSQLPPHYASSLVKKLDLCASGPRRRIFCPWSTVFHLAFVLPGHQSHRNRADPLHRN
jgi:hypothetical protein